MTISLCITVLNEEKNIASLLDSIYVGTKKPTEIVIVDGGSTDNTVEIIRHYQKKYGNIKLLIEKGGIAHGRNASIDIARGEIIAQIDSGCVAKPNWLAKLTEPFNNKNVDIVAGFYEMPAGSPLQAAINVFHGVPPERFDPKTFIPSARSVAFRKAVWITIGGYSEKLKNAGEDTLFFYESVKNNFRIVRVEEARVIWEEARNLTLKGSLKKFFNYAKGDAKTGIWWHPTKQLASHNIKISLIFIRYFIGLGLILVTILGFISPLVLVFLAILYLIYPIYKWHDVVKNWWGRFWLPVIQILSDFAVMSGFVSGILNKK
jgi:glycosyltransferase involved in cell wall biosynthesis